MGGLPLQELNRLELEFLYLIQFQLHIKLKDLQEYADQLLSMPIIDTTTAKATISKKQEQQPCIRSKITLPLTPPYHHHPYKIPLYKKKKLCLISPKD